MTPDVLVMGEVLVEVSSDEALDRPGPARVGFSGDALNAAAAAAAAGARTALLALVPDDELGDGLVRRVAELGIDASLIRRVKGQHGVYFVSADPSGDRQFCYARACSAGSTLSPADVDRTGVADAAVVVASGITCSLSASSAEAVAHLAEAVNRRGGRFVYDPNYRPRLTTPEAAGAHLSRLARSAAVVSPACPGETSQLLGLSDPAEAAAACLALGARAAAVTCGANGVVIADARGTQRLPAVPPPALVDQTGAGDVFIGTVAGRLACGDDLLTAARLGGAAASLSLQGRGGTGHIPTLRSTRSHLAGWAEATS
ncbi:hypothetical protein K6U06_21140 [Acidiferrimicrobium sp. IK]|uniref:PfkB family carbohydrate kinase n=1 Tax=Acidiferrimicrobium sp. IK TaxID=2871700 RepID=UPI0021CAED9B|nr:PfkB family carbohydrate kinase [Acidiferrimicrobium sp. IK]MCU4186885.1 hypothetical protein [Acidiferrimicrobium sp. IK]